MVLEARPLEPLNRILAPLDRLGLRVAQRQPEQRHALVLSHAGAAVKLQAHLLDALWPLLARGGRLLYATCTMLKRENTAQIERFLARTRDAVALAPTAPAGLQILPGETNMDGFYYACLGKEPSPR